MLSYCSGLIIPRDLKDVASTLITTYWLPSVDYQQFRREANEIRWYSTGTVHG